MSRGPFLRWRTLLLWTLCAASLCESERDEPPSLQLLQRNLQLGRGPAGRGPHSHSPNAFVGELQKLLNGCSGWDCLSQYVRRPDPSYSWTDSSMRLYGSVNGTGWSGALLQMISQEWLPEEVSPAIWNHSLVVISPDNVPATPWCLLYISLGFHGSAGAKAVEASNPDVLAAAEIAVSSGIRAAVLFNVPAELLTFTHSSYTAPMVEDATMAYSWAMFGNSPFGAWRPKPDLLAELPMTKAVVRALDTISAFAATEVLPGLTKPTKFALLGTSKRGHLCWHAASVDARVQAIIPIARALNMQGFLDMTQRELGGLPLAASDYAQKGGMLEKLADPEGPEGRWFINITDAYSYIDRFRGLPKLVINAANDEFFVPDHTRVWWPAVPQPKWHLMVPNSGHISGGQQIRSLAGLVSAFISGLVAAEDSPAALPKLTWEIKEAGTLTAKLDRQSPVPSKVVFWKATTCNARRRDFRLHNADKADACRQCGHEGFLGCVNEAVAWEGSAVKETGHRSFTWEASVTPREDNRWTAFYLTFHWPTGLRLSTEVSTVPVTVPFPDCPPTCISHIV